MRDKVKWGGDREALVWSQLLAPLLSFSSIALLTWTRLAAGARRGTAEAAVAGAEGRAAVASAGRAAKRDAIASRSNSIFFGRNIVRDAKFA